MNAIQDGNMLVVREEFDGDRDYYAYVGGKLVAVVAAENGGAEVAKELCAHAASIERRAVAQEGV